MVCADTSSLVAYWRGEEGPDVQVLNQALNDGSLVLAPVCLAEVLSDPALPPELEKAILRIPVLGVLSGYWERSGKLRARMWQRGYRPKLADTLIAQSCLDHQVPLVTRDRDFRGFGKAAALHVVI